jgi:hypothetical protein
VWAINQPLPDGIFQEFVAHFYGGG